MPQSAKPRPLHVDGGSFDEYYFRHCCGRPYGFDEHWTAFFGRIADVIVRDIRPRRVLDAGCAMGILVQALRERGVEAWGVDLSPYAISRCPEAVRPYCRVGSIADAFDARFDLICCIEVVEHMPASEGERAIANLCAHAGDVLFSSSPDDFTEPTHINVQPAEYWARLFAQHGFYRDTAFSAECVAPWAVRLRHSHAPFPAIVGDYERGLAGLHRANVELRASLLDAQRRLAAAERRLEETETTLGRQIDDLRAHVAALEPAAARADEASREYERAMGTIRNMERSVFWKARRWFGRR
ncbi:MAG: class I SAM-dependent methyltransferase [Vicinamibacterales bacterium]